MSESPTILPDLAALVEKTVLNFFKYWAITDLPTVDGVSFHEFINAIS